MLLRFEVYVTAMFCTYTYSPGSTHKAWVFVFIDEIFHDGLIYAIKIRSLRNCNFCTCTYSPGATHKAWVFVFVDEMFYDGLIYAFKI